MQSTNPQCQFVYGLFFQRALRVMYRPKAYFAEVFDDDQRTSLRRRYTVHSRVVIAVVNIGQ